MCVIAQVFLEYILALRRTARAFRSLSAILSCTGAWDLNSWKMMDSWRARRSRPSSWCISWSFMWLCRGQEALHPSSQRAVVPLWGCRLNGVNKRRRRAQYSSAEFSESKRRIEMSEAEMDKTCSKSIVEKEDWRESRRGKKEIGRERKKKMTWKGRRNLECRV